MRHTSGHDPSRCARSATEIFASGGDGVGAHTAIPTHIYISLVRARVALALSLSLSVSTDLETHRLRGSGLAPSVSLSRFIPPSRRALRGPGNREPLPQSGGCAIDFPPGVPAPPLARAISVPPDLYVRAESERKSEREREGEECKYRRERERDRQWYRKRPVRA